MGGRQCEICVVGSSRKAVASVVSAIEAVLSKGGGSVSGRHVDAGSDFDAAVDFRGCNAYVVCGDGNQSRLLVSNSARDTAAMHAPLEAALQQRATRELRGSGVLLAIVGGGSRGFHDPIAGEIFSASVEELLRKTDQELALQLVGEGCALSWTDQPSEEQLKAIAQSLDLLPPQEVPISTWARLSPVAIALSACGFCLLLHAAVERAGTNGKDGAWKDKALAERERNYAPAVKAGVGLLLLCAAWRVSRTA